MATNRDLHYVREYQYSRKYKFTFIWFSQVLLVFLTLSIVYWQPILIVLNFGAYCFNYFLLANSFNKKIFVHTEGKFVYRNVFRRRMSFNIEDIASIRRTKIRKGLMIELKEGKGYVYLTPFWKNWQILFRFVLNRTDPDKIVNREYIDQSLNL